MVLVAEHICQIIWKYKTYTDSTAEMEDLILNLRRGRNIYKR